MSEKGNYNNTGWVKHYYPDPNHGIMVPFYIKLDLIFRSNANPVDQFELMLKKRRPWDGDGKPMPVHYMKHCDHTKGGTVALLTESAHRIRHKAHPSGPEFKSEIDRRQFRTWSYNVIKTLAVDLIQGRIKHPMVTDDVRKQFTGDPNNPDDDPKGKRKSRFRRAAKFAERYQTEHKAGFSRGLETLRGPYQGIGGNRSSGLDYDQEYCEDKSKFKNLSGLFPAPTTPKPGGIEIMALEWTSNMPKCSSMNLEKNGKMLSIVFGNTKYYLPIDNIIPAELQCLLNPTFKSKTQRFCVDIVAAGEYYSLSFDGGVHECSSLSETMEKADLLLGAFAFGRNPFTGVLFQPKPGQLEGYRNPILETVRLLNTDKEYAAVRCRYRDVFLHPTLVCNGSFAIPATSVLDWWPELDFPNTVFKLVCRITLSDLTDRPRYYDIPESSSAIDPEAEVLLRPYKPLIEAFKKHGAEWIASEPVLRKVETAARVFQLLSVARSSGLSPSSLSSPPATTLTHYRRVDKRSEFRDPAPDSGEPNLVCQALRFALLSVIPLTKDTLDRASQYLSLGLMCYKLESFDEAIEYFLKAAEHYNNQTTTEYMATEGLRHCFVSILRSLSATLGRGDDYSWILDKKGEERPIWWISLHSVFGPVLDEFDSVVQELRFGKVNSEQAKAAAPLCAEMLIIHLSYAILTWFEQQQDLEGILPVYEVLTFLYNRGILKMDVQTERWPSIEKASTALGEQMRAWTNKDILAVQEELTSEDSPVREEDLLDVQEKRMDFYFVKGEINKAMACALVAVRMQEELNSSINDRARVVEKATMIARTARAQKDMDAAKAIIERAENLLQDRDKLQWCKNEIGIKKALLVSLNNAIILLYSHDQELEKTAMLLMRRVRIVIAEVNIEDPAIAAKWVIAAQINEEAAKSLKDDVGLNRYAKRWLLDNTQAAVSNNALENVIDKMLLVLLLRELITS
ncbi:hypothetical protein BGX26_006039 [Mortierella sp. AD094]|nr:hypothetical protein BGX26_006039 [Mortierella sp. AD094]